MWRNLDRFSAGLNVHEIVVYISTTLNALYVRCCGVDVDVLRVYCSSTSSYYLVLHLSLYGFSGFNAG